MLFYLRLISSVVTGVFFLFGAGRLSLVRSQPRRAIEFYTKATSVQAQYRNLHHISFWEIAVANLCLWDVASSLACWRVLQAEATVRVETTRTVMILTLLVRLE
jgi:hypothetical protein